MISTNIPLPGSNTIAASSIAGFSDTRRPTSTFSANTTTEHVRLRSRPSTGRQRRLSDEDLQLAQALADVASISIVHAKVAADQDKVVGQLQTALTSRVLIEQAKGILSQRGNLEMDEALARLRGFARHHNRLLTDVARAVVARELPASRVLAPAPPKPARQPRPRV